MITRTEKLRNLVSDGSDTWRIRAVNPYLIGYRMAFGGFTETMKKQAEADKAQAEMFISMASIVGGSLIMATVGETALRAVAGNMALNFICNHNLDRTFTAMSVAADNKTLMFALGKVLDTVKDEANKRIKERVTALLKTEEIKTSDPLDKTLEFDSLIRSHKLAAYHAAEEIENDRKMSDANKHAAFVALEKAPICTPPNGSVSATALAPKIELGIYLTKVLASAELDTTGPSYSSFGKGGLGKGGFGEMGGMGQPSPKITSKPITQSPSAPDYPKAIQNADGSSQWVGYTMTADPFTGTGTVRQRIDELHKIVFKEEFYPKIGPFGTYAAEQKRAELLKAERQLNRLGQETRPLSLLGLMS